MEIVVSQEQGSVPVSVLHIKGDLDASSYLELVNTAQKLYNEGARFLLLDMSNMLFISSAGLASLHIITKMFRGETSNPEDGWATYKSIDRERETGFQKRVKLLNPRRDVAQVLETVGFNQFFEVYSNSSEAVQSFM